MPRKGGYGGVGFCAHRSALLSRCSPFSWRVSVFWRNPPPAFAVCRCHSERLDKPAVVFFSFLYDWAASRRRLRGSRCQIIVYSNLPLGKSACALPSGPPSSAPAHSGKVGEAKLFWQANLTASHWPGHCLRSRVRTWVRLEYRHYLCKRPGGGMVWVSFVLS